MARDRFAPEFDPDCGDIPLTTARQDIVIGRWQGLRELLRATGPDWLSRGHRARMLAQACAGSSTVESWPGRSIWPSPRAGACRSTSAGSTRR